MMGEIGEIPHVGHKLGLTMLYGNIYISLVGLIVGRIRIEQLPS